MAELEVKTRRYLGGCTSANGRVLFGIRRDPVCPNSVSLVILTRILNGQAGSTKGGVAFPTGTVTGSLSLKTVP